MMANTIQCHHSPRSASGTGLLAFACPLEFSARHLVHALGTVYEAPTFSQWDPAFSLSHALVCEASRTCPWHCLRGAHVQPVEPGILAFACPLAFSARHLVHALGTVYEAPTFSQWDPAFSLSHALWHSLRRISYMPLALSTRRPRSASGTRPSRFLMPFGIVCEASRTCSWHCLRGAHVQPVRPGLLAFACPLAFSAMHLVHALGTVYEAPTFSQWDLAFLYRSRPFLPQHSRCDGSENHFVLTQPHCVAASNQHRTTRTGSPCAQSRRREWFPACRQSRVSISSLRGETHL